jgi:hypothetical protein
MSSTAPTKDYFHTELERRLEVLESPEYQRDAEEYAPLPTSHFYWMFVLAIVAPLILVVISYATW